MSTCHETNHKVYGAILSRNTCHKIGLNTFEEKKRSCAFSSATARRKKPKKSFSSDWAENLAESDKTDKASYFDPGAMAEGVKRAGKHRMWPVGFHFNI